MLDVDMLDVDMLDVDMLGVDMLDVDMSLSRYAVITLFRYFDISLSRYFVISICCMIIIFRPHYCETPRVHFYCVPITMALSPRGILAASSQHPRGAAVAKM